MSATSTLAGSFRALRGLRLRFRPRIDRFRGRSAAGVRAELIDDPQVKEAVGAHVSSTGESEAQAWARVHAYAKEIVPSFSLVAYYRLGYFVARALIPLFYRVTVGYEAREALSAIPRSSTVVYLMNHRSNADYVVVAFVLSGEVAVSYAVGEWARVWPLETLFKSFGSYFVRRGYPEPLYHKVLERYVQLITRHGVTQGIFLEGGLSRDGRFRVAKLGLLGLLRLTLKGSAARVVGEERSNAEILDRALVMLTMRHVVEADGLAFRIDRSQEPLLRYYANSIEHLLEPLAGPA